MADTLYVIGADSLVKIGITKSVQSRLVGLQVASPIPITCLACFNIDEHTREFERSVHLVLREKRVSGEWFEASLDEVIEAIHRASELTGVSVERVEPPAEIKKRQKKKMGPKGGRPPSSKVIISIRLDPDIVQAFRNEGAGWQSRMNDALRSVMPKA